MTDFLARHKLNKTATKPKLDSLLVYYGYPISYKGLNETNAVIAAISGSYNYWIVGDTYGNASHEAYASTNTIIDGVRALGVKVYGYVPIGQSTEGLTIAQIKTKIDEWVTVGVDGIFLDEFGFDYLNTRAKQIEIVEYVHAQNLPYCANAWVVEDFACDDVSEIGYTSGDWRYTNFTTYNPSNLPLPRNTSDVYMFENFCFSNTGVSVIWDTQERAVNVTNRAITGNFNVWALAVLAESSQGVFNINKIGPTLKTADDISAYVSANAYLFGYNIVGIGGYSFGSGGSPINIPLFELPNDAKTATVAASNNYGTKVCTRLFGSVKITITNKPAEQKVVIESTPAKLLQNQYPAIPEVVETDGDIIFTDAPETLAAGNTYIFLAAADEEAGTYDLTMPATGVEGQKIKFRNRSGITTIGLLPNGNKIENVVERHNINNVNAKGTLLFTDALGWIYIND